MKWGLAIALAIALIIQMERNAHHNKYWIWDDGDVDARVAINTSNIYFPKDFVWGTATSSHQVEGDNYNNNWAEFEKYEGNIKHGQKTGKACDHWNRYEEDILLMKELGVNAYRFSLEWSRIEPEENRYDQEAIKHYHDVIDALIKNGITPWITLHHFANPLWFHNKGDFERRANIEHLVRFSIDMFKEYSPKVKNWCTINEPSVFVSHGWFTGMFPPGKEDWNMAGEAMANILEAHVRIYYALKVLPNGKESQIGIVNNFPQFDPWRTWHPLDIIVSNILDHAFNDVIIQFFKTGVFNFRLLHVSVKRTVPEAVGSNDYLGINYYSHFHVRFEWNLTQPFRFVHPPHSVMTDFSYPIYPEGLYRALQRTNEIAPNLPIYITENGIADEIDDRRHFFIRRYIYAVSKAIADGYPVKGYFYWSLLDNFEWAEGYLMRFGLYEVDFETQKRTLRDGSKYFQKVVKKFSSQA